MIDDEQILGEAHCFECGRAMSSLPTWLADAKVKFQCEECRQKHPKPVGVHEPEPRRTAADEDEIIAEEPVVPAEDEDEAADEVHDDEDSFPDE